MMNLKIPISALMDALRTIDIDRDGCISVREVLECVKRLLR